MSSLLLCASLDIHFLQSLLLCFNFASSGKRETYHLGNGTIILNGTLILSKMRHLSYKNWTLIPWKMGHLSCGKLDTYPWKMGYLSSGKMGHLSFGKWDTYSYEKLNTYSLENGKILL